MTAGTPKIVVRLNQAIQNLIQSEVEARNFGNNRKPYTVSDFVRSAVSEKLKHLARGRKSRKTKVQLAESEKQQVEQWLDSHLKEVEQES